MDHHGRQTLTSQESRPTSLLAGSCISQFHTPGQASAFPAGKPRDEALVAKKAEEIA